MPFPAPGDLPDPEIEPMSLMSPALAGRFFATSTTWKLWWYSHLFQNFPQFIVIHTVKGFGIVNKAEIDAFLELFCFSMIQQMLAI